MKKTYFVPQTMAETFVGGFIMQSNAASPVSDPTDPNGFQTGGGQEIGS